MALWQRNANFQTAIRQIVQDKGMIPAIKELQPCASSAKTQAEVGSGMPAIAGDPRTVVSDDDEETIIDLSSEYFDHAQTGTFGDAMPNGIFHKRLEQQVGNATVEG